MEAILIPEASDSEDAETAPASRPNASTRLTTSASEQSRLGTTPQTNSAAANTEIEFIQAALRQAQLSASEAYSQAQQNARTGSSASSRSRLIVKPTGDTKKMLQEAAKKLLILYAPWPLWTVSGCWITRGSSTVATGQISTNDDAGTEILSYVPLSFVADFLSSAGQTLIINTMSSVRSSHINRLRNNASLIFGPGFEQSWFASKFKRGSIQKLQDLLGATVTPKGKKYRLLPPILFPDGSQNKRDVFLNPALVRTLKVILFGPSSLSDNGTHSGPKPAGVKWKLNEVTPGAIAFAAVLVRFLLSPDEDFSQAGFSSGINYTESFEKYKEMLTEERDSSMYTRIFEEFNRSLFNTTPPRSDDVIADDGDYDSELEAFRNETRTDSLPEGIVIGVGAKKTSPPSSLPTSPIQPDHHVSISVTSHVSHTIAASSQVSNIINSSVTLPPEHEVTETPPSPLKATRPAPKKKGSKSSKLTTATTTTSDADANATSVTLQKRGTRRTKVTPAELPSDIGDPEKRKQKYSNARKEDRGNAEETPEEGEGDDEEKMMQLDLTQDEHIDTGDAPAGEKGKAVEKSPHEGGAYGGSVEDRQRGYGSNILPARKSKSLLQLMWLALKDEVLILLSIAAIISLALGFFQDFGLGREPGKPPVDWVEGVAIIVATFIVVMVVSLNNWQKERQSRIPNDKREERGVKVVRFGIERVIDIKELVVGDIALLEPSEIVPCNGIFISGHNVRCDDSGATGESNAIKKVGHDECITLREQAKCEGADPHAFDAPNAHTDCFLVSGPKVLEGYGKYVAIAVGQKSFNGRIMMALRGEPDPTPLQEKLNDLAEHIAKIGGSAGLVLFITLIIRFFVQLGTGEPACTASENGITFTRILIISVTLVVVAVLEGPPLAVTLALAFATKRMTAEKLLVCILDSCETMANASVVCTNKTGTLTQNFMSVVASSVGIHAKFIRNLKDNKARTNAPDQEQDQSQEQDVTKSANERQVNRKHANDFSIKQGDLNTILSPQLKRLINQSITINSTAFEDINPESKQLAFVGSKTETALLQFAKDLGWENWKETWESATIMHMIPFSSERKAMGVVVRLQSGRYHLFLKGALEILTKKCTRHVVVSKNPDHSQHADSEIETKVIDEITKDNISRTIIFYANQMLRTIALCYRDFESWPPAGTHFHSADEVSYEDLSRDMTLVAITSIEDPLRPNVHEAVVTCHHAGVTIKMCTGDNVLTARSIATQCGIYTAGGIIMEGPVFRALDPQERLEVVPRLQVLARSSPEDKKILVKTLRSLGEIVGVTGDGTNDGPALKTAHVGFSMGIAGTETAKKASDIILMGDNFALIVKVIMWGRCVNDAVRKFLQFQISTNITTVQLLWINIIMDTFAALPLATDHGNLAVTTLVFNTFVDSLLFPSPADIVE